MWKRPCGRLEYFSGEEWVGNIVTSWKRNGAETYFDLNWFETLGFEDGLFWRSFDRKARDVIEISDGESFQLCWSFPKCLDPCLQQILTSLEPHCRQVRLDIESLDSKRKRDKMGWDLRVTTSFWDGCVVGTVKRAPRFGGVVNRIAATGADMEFGFNQAMTRKSDSTSCNGITSNRRSLAFYVYIFCKCQSMMQW